MSVTDPGERSAAEIEREVERTRARLTGTVEELKERVSPGQMAEQAMEWVRGSGGREFAQNLGTTVRDNPVPVVLIAAGIAWLAFGGGRNSERDWSSRESRGMGYGRGAYPGDSFPRDYRGEGDFGEYHSPDEGGPSIGERAGEAAEGLRDRAANLAGRVGDTAEGLRDQAADMAGRVGDAAGGALHAAADTARSLASGVADTGRDAARRANQAWQGASELGDRAYRYGAGAGRNLASTVEEQPLLLGGLGLAFGALMGALLPHSPAEDRLMGEARDRVAGRLSSMAGEAYEKVRDVAGEQAERAQQHLGEAYERARERVGSTGISPTEGASALGGVARELRQAVERTAQDAASALREAGSTATGDKATGEQQRQEARPKPPGTSSTGIPPTRSGPEGTGPV